MTIRDTQGLIDAGLLEPADRAAVDAVAARYAVALTPAMRALIEAPDDPIARQFVPSTRGTDHRAARTCGPDRR